MASSIIFREEFQRLNSKKYQKYPSEKNNISTREDSQVILVK
ncbi:hypothetical protein NHE_0067 [Neorickettsia helminthoeca str. Oregon]|uniref:Uncharacterized protein n=1 Tax=Neorickettsia helminthoeca str. Oregon TaxID=1286528 RepID=X5H3C5_9RICK|nr:hypothetical protein NHE_0067 [Neorickettsia helminthoeca str. Oregon]